MIKLVPLTVKATFGLDKVPSWSADDQRIVWGLGFWVLNRVQNTSRGNFDLALRLLSLRNSILKNGEGWWVEVWASLGDIRLPPREKDPEVTFEVQAWVRPASTLMVESPTQHKFYCEAAEERLEAGVAGLRRLEVVPGVSSDRRFDYLPNPYRKVR